jgi:hypothetical protein
MKIRHRYLESQITATQTACMWFSHRAHAWFINWNFHLCYTKTILMHARCICAAHDAYIRCRFYMSPTEHAAPVVARRRTWGSSRCPYCTPRRRSHCQSPRNRCGSNEGRCFRGRRWGPAQGTPGTTLPHQHLHTTKNNFHVFFKLVPSGLVVISFTLSRVSVLYCSASLLPWDMKATASSSRADATRAVAWRAIWLLFLGCRSRRRVKGGGFVGYWCTIDSAERGCFYTSGG